MVELAWGTVLRHGHTVEAAPVLVAATLVGVVHDDPLGAVRLAAAGVRVGGGVVVGGGRWSGGCVVVGGGRWFGGDKSGLMSGEGMFRC